MTLAEIVIIGLAAWRIAHALVEESGPWDVINNFRELIHGNESGVIQATFQSQLFGCVLCMSAWTAAACIGLYELEPLIVQVIAVWGFACAIQKVSAHG